MFGAVTASGGIPLALVLGAVLVLVLGFALWRLISHHRQHTRAMRERGRQRREFWGWE